MEIVALHLQAQALSRQVALEQDQFARSSFNRFYYAAFLRVRGGLADMAVGGDEVAHANMPTLLRETITIRLKKEVIKASRVDDSDLASACSFALAAASNLAKLLDEGRMTRVTADYRPDQPVDFSTKPDFKLNAVSVATARSWRRRADIYMTAIEAAWKQINA